jgi:PhnB protein
VALKEVQPILWVSSIEDSIEFYMRRLGFDLAYSMPGEDGKTIHASVVNGSVTLMLGYKEMGSVPVEGRRLGGGAELYCYADDVDSYYERVRRAGTTLTQEIMDQFWGDRTFTVTDPDGYVLTFAQTVRAYDPAADRPPELATV